MDGEGKEPDPRFTLANERTFLTWLSTSLALSAGGVAMAAVSSGVFLDWLRIAMAVVLVALAAVAAGMAYPRWRRIQQALRRDARCRRPGWRRCSVTASPPSRCSP
ncbi:YidH family protein [Thermocatellispora tengchongensis]|uniref:YidH family protein n=1 Tax=Thermocatellispora tengchongensis TaxID=1073253 RepID=UPI003625A756